MILSHLSLFVVTILILCQYSLACVVPTPLESISELSTEVILEKLETLNVPYLFLPLADAYIGGLVSIYESPVQVSSLTAKLLFSKILPSTNSYCRYFFFQVSISESPWHKYLQCCSHV